MGLKLTAAIITASLTLLTYGYQRLLLSRTRAALVRKHGCQPLPHYAHKDPFLGLDYIWRIMAALPTHQLLDLFNEGFDTLGTTFQYTQLGTEVLVTGDAENIHSILSKDFSSFGNEPVRGVSFAPLFDGSFFSIDGPVWHRSRKAILPLTSRNAYSDFSMLESHLQRLLALIPKDQSDVKIERLMEKLVWPRKPFLTSGTFHD